MSRPISRFVFAAFCTIWVSSALAAPLMRTQPPCTPSPDRCFEFWADESVPIFRSFTFTAPSAGYASVTFHGTLQCYNLASNRVVVDLETAIVTRPEAPVAWSVPSGLKHAAVLEASADGLNPSVAFNLASTRIVGIAAAGARTYYFKAAKLRMDSGSACRVFNAAFSVVFLPR